MLQVAQTFTLRSWSETFRDSIENGLSRTQWSYYSVEKRRENTTAVAVLVVFECLTPVKTAVSSVCSHTTLISACDEKYISAL